jgi:hypothetical protein
VRRYLLLLILLPAITEAEDFGPIPTRNHRAIALPFFRFEPHIGLTPYREQRWTIGYSVANDFRRLPETGGAIVEEDVEIQRLALGYRKGISDRDEVAIEVPFLSRGGGFLDPIIDWWHANVLHWSDQGRDTTAFGRSVVRVPGHAEFGSASGLGDVSVTISRQVAQRWSLSVGIKLPTGDPERLLGSGNADAGAYLQTWLPINSRWRLHGQLGVVAQGRATALDSARGWVHQEGLALTWSPNSRDTWTAQWQGESSSVVTGVPGSDATHRILTFGYRRRLSSTQSIEGYFSEDRDVFNGAFPEGANIGPDFTAGLRLTIRF